MSICSNLPFLGYGMGLRSPHYPYILENSPDIDWFEIISENFMDSDGKPKRILEQLKEQYPIVMHGVSMSIGTIDPINSEYLKKLKQFADWLEPPWISDHLCWTGVAHKNSHDLLPIPYTTEALDHIIKRIKKVQDYLERPLILENPSTYLEFSASSMHEWDFISAMAEQSGCGLLLDVNNIYVSCYNHGLDPKTYIDSLPHEKIVQIHLAGHSNNGSHIIDTHDDHVVDEVWNLYRYVVSKIGKVSTMVEWDDNIPEFDIVRSEVEKAQKQANKQDTIILPNFTGRVIKQDQEKPTHLPYEQILHKMQDNILKTQISDHDAKLLVYDKKEFSAYKQINIYRNGYRNRLFRAINEEYIALRHYLGDNKMDEAIKNFIEITPSTYFDISHYITNFPLYINSHYNVTAYEICEFETAISLLFHAKETLSLNSNFLHNISPEQLSNIKLLPRHALKLFAFTSDINTYYQQVIDNIEGIIIKPSPSHVAVFRHEYKMWRLDLEAEEYKLISMLFAGYSITEAIEFMINGNYKNIDEKNITNWFARWIQNGLLAQNDEQAA